jgi:uncharacterized protein YcnI
MQPFSPTRPRPRTARRRRGFAIGVVTVGLLAVGVGSASAHVTVHPDTTTAGSYAQLTFRVPTESADASTISLRVTLPQDHPFTSVSIRPVPGWTATVREESLPKPVDVGGATITKAARTVTWHATTGHAIKPGQYQEFPISVGRLPEGGTVDLPAVQTYSDGSVVKWDQVAKAGAKEPDHPAPSFTVEPASSSNATATGASAAGADNGDAGGDGVARGLAGGALALSVIGLGITVADRRRHAAGWTGDRR